MYILAIAIFCIFALLLAAIARTSCDRALEPTLADTRNQSISPKRF
jgi:hypothetical protein